MKPKTSKKGPSHALQNRLAELEKKAGQEGIHLHYDMLQAAGLKLKGGLCRIRDEYHLFIDKRKTTNDRIELLEACLDRPLPEDVPEVDEKPL